MKSFKEHLNEGHASQYQQVYSDQDAMPSAPEAIEVLNPTITAPDAAATAR